MQINRILKELQDEFVLALDYYFDLVAESEEVSYGNLAFIEWLEKKTPWAIGDLSEINDEQVYPKLKCELECLRGYWPGESDKDDLRAYLINLVECLPLIIHKQGK